MAGGPSLGTDRAKQQDVGALLEPAVASGEQLLARRPAKVVAVALANKMARIAWAVLERGETYRAPALVVSV
jgi:hypothetical protein